MTWESKHVWSVGEDFPFSTSQVNRAGEKIRRAVVAGGSPSTGDLELLDRFRSWHSPTLNLVQVRLAEGLIRGGVAGAGPIVGRPLKTREAIVAKLVREKSRLATIQDIAGTRIIVDDLAHQQAVLEATLAAFSDADPRIAKDTRETADALGYRGLHVVVRLDDRLAEIQIRTSAQNFWAQLVEKLDEVRGTDLKHGVGPVEALDGMKRLSDILRRQETGEEKLGAGAAVLATLIAAAIVTMKASERPVGD